MLVRVRVRRPRHVQRGVECRSSWSAFSGECVSFLPGALRPLSDFPGAVPSGPASSIGCWLVARRRVPCPIPCAVPSGFCPFWLPGVPLVSALPPGASRRGVRPKPAGRCTGPVPGVPNRGVGPRNRRPCLSGLVGVWSVGSSGRSSGAAVPCLPYRRVQYNRLRDRRTAIT